MTSNESDSDLLYPLFHENSKNTGFETGDDLDAEAGGPVVDYTTFPGAESVALSEPEAPADGVLELLQQRRSPDSFTGEPIDKSAVATLLAYGAGITDHGATRDDHRRAYPSGGARYPLETYACVLDSTDLPPGLYHYNVLEHELERLRSGSLREELDFFAHDGVQTASLVLFLVADFDRTTDKYGDLGYRLVMQESGHLMQNICLIAEHLGLGCRPIAGFIDREANDFLERYGLETTVYTGFIGDPS